LFFSSDPTCYYNETSPPTNKRTPPLPPKSVPQLLAKKSLVLPPDNPPPLPAKFVEDTGSAQDNWDVMSVKSAREDWRAGNQSCAGNDGSTEDTLAQRVKSIETALVDYDGSITDDLGDAFIDGDEGADWGAVDTWSDRYNWNAEYEDCNGDDDCSRVGGITDDDRRRATGNPGSNSMASPIQKMSIVEQGLLAFSVTLNVT